MTSVSQATRASGVLREDGVENRIGDLVGDLVGVPFRDGLRREQIAALTAHVSRTPLNVPGIWLVTRAHRTVRHAPEIQEFYTMSAASPTTRGGGEIGRTPTGAALRERACKSASSTGRRGRASSGSPEIGAALEQVGGEGMPQHVRADVPGHARLHPVVLQQLPEADPRQRPAARVDEEPRRRLARPGAGRPSAR